MTPMPLRIEDYALIGDCQAAALVGRDGSIDWLCLPRFDSGACFAALLGTAEHGRWLLAPQDGATCTGRRYRPETLVLETDWCTADGEVTVVDCMPIRGDQPDVVRVVIGRRGRVKLHTEIVLRFDYGSIDPWVRCGEDGAHVVAGPDSVRIRAPEGLRNESGTLVGDMVVAAGESAGYVLTWYPSHLEAPAALYAEEAVEQTEQWWRAWAEQCQYRGKWRDAVLRSLITLKALTYAPTGGIVAAPTTSLPEHLGGLRNWDYRYCWVRDATFTLYALQLGGFHEEAGAWREWLRRAMAGRPGQPQIMYGLGGERRLHELQLPWLPGYEGSVPVRVGNRAYSQFQLDVYGEIMDAFYFARRNERPDHDDAWDMELVLLEHLKEVWREPDEGIWEVRGPRRHFVHSKMMAWVAFDRAVKAVDRHGMCGPVDEWRTLRSEIHREICER
ncbi:MAG TPA: glycoside hydrolase family 15 protein, partial [Terriglobales bacterium]|nr:glycoside hydrolase family 15 protein [Terriglobales bacterium]